MRLRWRRVAGVAVVAALLLASPVWHALAPGPSARDRAVALHRWYTGLRPPAADPRRVAVVSDVFRVLRGEGASGAESFASVAQAGFEGAWIDVSRGDIGLAKTDATGERLAFTVSRAARTDRLVRQWVDVISWRSGLEVTSLRTPLGSTVVGWFGPYVVVQPPGGRALTLLDAEGEQPARTLADGIMARRDGAGDVQLAPGRNDRCAGAASLGLTDRRGLETCPADGLLALSPDGRRAVTRDLRWLDLATGTYRPVAGRPVGRAASAVDFLDDRRIRVRLPAGRRPLTALCSLNGTCRRSS